MDYAETAYHTVVCTPEMKAAANRISMDDYLLLQKASCAYGYNFLGFDVM
jgi:hypothetical protein